MEKMKILVTGSEGFIGRELVKELTKLKHEVIGFDLSKGQNLLNERDLELIKGVDVVIHLAALLNEKETEELMHEVNVQGTELLLEKCVEFKVKRFIYLSTVGVMGNIQKTADESFPLKPRTKYEKTKALAEKKVNEFQELIPVTIIRSALVLGPNKYWKEIVSLVKKNFPLIGDGKNSFQLIYFKDLVSAIIFCLNNSETENETFIVAEEKGKKLIEIYALIQKELGIKKNIRLIPVFLGKLLALLKRDSLISLPYIERLTRKRSYSIEKIKSIGWKPRYSTEQAIKETIEALTEMELKEKQTGTESS
jgi:nucleoside-diphosphate-sugar epimerase